MAEFIYNDGSYRYRGVWHLVEGEAKITVVPEKREEHTYDIRDWHLDRCDLNQRYWNHVERRYVGGPSCTCGHSGEVIGHFKHITITPEHTIVSVEKVACNQVGRLRTGGVKHLYPRYKQATDGEVRVKTNSIVKPLFQVGDEFPAGPWCSRCQRKLDERN